MKSRIHLLRYNSCTVLPCVPLLSPPGCLLGTRVALMNNKARPKYSAKATNYYFLACYCYFLYCSLSLAQFERPLLCPRPGGGHCEHSGDLHGARGVVEEQGMRWIRPLPAQRLRGSTWELSQAGLAWREGGEVSRIWDKAE